MDVSGVQTLTAVIHKEENMYVALCPEVGTVSQGSMLEEVNNLKEATELHLEEFPLEEKRKSFITTFEVASVVETRRSLGRLAKILCNRFDFEISGRSGSHVRLSKTTLKGKTGTVVPMHKELEIGTLKGVPGLAKIDPDEFARCQQVIQKFPDLRMRLRRFCPSTCTTLNSSVLLAMRCFSSPPIRQLRNRNQLPLTKLQL